MKKYRENSFSPKTWKGTEETDQYIYWFYFLNSKLEHMVIHLVNNQALSTYSRVSEKIMKSHCFLHQETEREGSYWLMGTVLTV